MQTPSVRDIKLNTHHALVFGYIRASTVMNSSPETPQDLEYRVKDFTPIFEPHHFLLFDIKQTRRLRFSATPALLEDSESKSRLPKIHTILIQPNEPQFLPIQFLRYSMNKPMRCLKNNLSDLLAREVPSHFTSTMNSEHIAQINGVNNDHLDIIWERFPNATFTTEFTFPIRSLKLWEEDFLDDIDEIKKLICVDVDDEKIVDVFNGHEFLCKMHGKCNFKMSWTLEHEENESFIPRFNVDVSSEKVDIDIEYDEVFFPMVKNLWKVFRLEGICRDERNWPVLWDEIGQYESYCVQLVVHGENFVGYEVTEEMMDDIVESLDGFEGDFCVKLVGVRCWSERE